MPRLGQIEHSADRAFLLKARICFHIRGKNSPDLFTRTVDGLFRLKPQRTTKTAKAGELANDILHFQSLGTTNVTLSYADGLGRAGGRRLVLSSSAIGSRTPMDPEFARSWSGGRRVCGTRQVQQ